MKNFLLLISIFICLSINAQITITQSDVPSVGDTIRYSVTTDNNDYVITDTNYTWDYSSLTSTGQGRYDFKSALAVNPVYVIPFGLFGFGVKISDGFGAGPITLSNIYNFFTKSATKYSIKGYGAEVSGIPLPSTYSDEDEYYQFPLNYGDMDTSTFDVTISIPTIGGIRMQGTRINIVEGWGTVITPYATNNAIKVKTIIQEIDSINISLLPFPFAIPRNSVTYKWLCNTENIPALEVTGTVSGTGTFAANQIRYRDIYRASAIPFFPTANFKASLTNCTMYDTVTLTNRTTPLLPTSSYVWTVTPTTFNYVSGTSNTSTSPKVLFTATGLYTVNLSSTLAAVGTGGVAVTDDSTATDYILVRDIGAAIQSIDPISEFKVYPNPVQNVIQIDKNINVKSVQIIDLNGKTILSDLDFSAGLVNVESLSKGSYFIELIDNKGKITLDQFVKY